MFQKIRYQLLLSYLAVLMVILAVFAIAVRITFANSLREELADRLAILAEAASGELDLEDEQLAGDGADLLLDSHQAVQWFDTQGHLIDQRGKDPLTLPLNPKQTFQNQTLPYSAQGVTLPVREEEKNGELIGYVRASESHAEIYGTLRRLDWGLGGGIGLALVLSGLGGVWLTRQAMQPIEKSFQRLQQFTADASHELRNPLMAIKSNAAVALKYAEGMRESDVEKFQAIASATTQMTALTEDLLMLARNQTPQLKRSAVDLKTILEQLIQLYKPQAEAKQVELKIQLSQPVIVCGDPVQITRLFNNLIDNALRYTSNRGTINVWGCGGHTVVVRIQDTGIGIAPDQLEHIFERFWRAEKARSYSSRGFGLGLAIAHDIAQNHGGSITVTSQLGVGSCFTVRLPAHEN